MTPGLSTALREWREATDRISAASQAAKRRKARVLRHLVDRLISIEGCAGARVAGGKVCALFGAMAIEVDVSSNGRAWITEGGCNVCSCSIDDVLARVWALVGRVG